MFAFLEKIEISGKSTIECEIAMIIVNCRSYELTIRGSEAVSSFGHQISELLIKTCEVMTNWGIVEIFESSDGCRNAGSTWAALSELASWCMLTAPKGKSNILWPVEIVAAKPRIVEQYFIACCGK